MTNTFNELLFRSSNETIIMDGGMGTTTEDRGVDTQNALWGSFALLTRDGLKINDEIHRDFVTAGAEILIANTHNAFVTSCEDGDLVKAIDIPELADIAAMTDHKLRANAVHTHIIEAAFLSAKRAVPKGKKVVVATCIGSVDTPYATEANVEAPKVTEVLKFEIKARQAVDCDMIILETLTTREEIEGAARAAEACTELPISIGLTCGEKGKTLGGVTMSEVVEQFGKSPPCAYFIQCTRYDYVEAALQALIDATNPDDVLGVYANDGRTWDYVAKQWEQTERITPEIYASHAKKWRAMGARIIGGCCGTSPEHIKALAGINL